MPEIGPAVKKSIGHAPPWLKADSELNYSSDDEIVEKETERSKGKKAVPESRKPSSESSDPKSSSSEDLIIGGDDLPADGQSGATWKSNIQSSALESSGIQMTSSMKKLDKALFHALKRCVTGPVALHFDVQSYRVTKCSYVQVTLLTG